MNPEIEPMLEEAFESFVVETPSVGRVDLEPDYESGLSAAEVATIVNELRTLLAGVKVDPAALAKHEGQSVALDAYPALRKFVRRISLFGRSADPNAPPWVEVIPPGNWI